MEREYKELFFGCPWKVISVSSSDGSIQQIRISSIYRDEKNEIYGRIYGTRGLVKQISINGKKEWVVVK
jgi:hypothetical protein